LPQILTILIEGKTPDLEHRNKQALANPPNFLPALAKEPLQKSILFEQGDQWLN